MLTRNAFVLMLVMTFGACVAAFAEMNVVSTSPANGAKDVDPSITQFRVKFSEAVDTSGYSFVVTDSGAPVESTGKPLFTEYNTVCVLPIRLSPGMKYSIGINSETHKNFRSAADANVTVTPCVVTFTTSGGDKPSQAASPIDEAAPEAAEVTVVRTYPEQGAKGIDPKLTYIRVRFSAPVNPVENLLVKSVKGQFPKVVGKPKYEDGNQLCILPVKLMPGTTYSVGINSQNAVTPYTLVFTTAKAKPKK